MMLRTRMVRRKTNLKTGQHTSCNRCNRNSNGLFRRAILYRNLQEKWPWTHPRLAFCTSLRSCEIHTDRVQQLVHMDSDGG